jgi:hypothetical protein
MPSEFDGSVLAIMNQDDTETGTLCGTGIVLSPTVVLTCAHLFADFQIEDKRRSLPNVTVLCGQAAFSPSHIQISHNRDICCLRFDAIPNAVPVRLARASRLQGLEVSAVGYVADCHGPRRNLSHRLKVVHELQMAESGRLQGGQLDAGLPLNFSGGPVLARSKNTWLTVGMLQSGNGTAAKSHFIAVDLIAAFLSEHNIRVAVEELPPEPAAQPAQMAAAGSFAPVVNFTGDMKRPTVNVIQSQNIKKD